MARWAPDSGTFMACSSTAPWLQTSWSQQSDWEQTRPTIKAHFIMLIGRNLWTSYSPAHGWFYVCSELLKQSIKVICVPRIKSGFMMAWERTWKRLGLTWAASPVNVEDERYDGTNHESKADWNNDHHHGFCTHTAGDAMTTRCFTTSSPACSLTHSLTHSLTVYRLSLLNHLKP